MGLAGDAETAGALGDSGCARCRSRAHRRESTFILDQLAGGDRPVLARCVPLITVGGDIPGHPSVLEPRRRGLGHAHHVCNTVSVGVTHRTRLLLGGALRVALTEPPHAKTRP